MESPGLRKKNAGFTLIEILVVIVIIGVLSIIGVSKYTEFITSSRLRGCVANQTTVDKTVGQWETQNFAIPQFSGNTPVAHNILFLSNGLISGGSLAANTVPPAPERLISGSDLMLKATKTNEVFMCPEEANTRGGIDELQAAAIEMYNWKSNGGGIPELNNRRRGTQCMIWNTAVGQLGPDGTPLSRHAAGAETTN